MNEVLAAAAHEALGRMLSKQPFGEADIANLAAFAQHFLDVLREDEILKAGEVVPPVVRLSWRAKSGPAFEPNREG